MPDPHHLNLIAVSVGNTRSRIGTFRAGRLEESVAIANTDPAAVARAVLDAQAADGAGPVVIASVNEPAAEALAHTLRDQEIDVYRFGHDLVIPIQMALRDERTIGQDRLLNALGAFSRAKQACIVIDAGTAVTVDFVDGQGTFQGGAIAPGVNMMLRALHEQTAALPPIRFEASQTPAEDSPFGKETRTAMLIGVQAAARGMARLLIDRYAEFYGAYPQVIATGGDARALFDGDDLIEHIVPDLTLLGIQAACAMQLGGDEDEEDEEA